MFIPAEYVLANEAVQRVANSLAPEAMALTEADARKPENFDSQHRAISGALDRLLQALSDGGLTARLLDAESGGLIDVPTHVWRSDAGREALWWSRLGLYGPPGPDVIGAVVIAEVRLGKWLDPRESALVPQSIVDAVTLVLAEAHFSEHNDKPFKSDIVAALIQDGYGVKAAEKAYGSLPPRLKRGKGDHAAKSALDRRNTS